MKIRGMPQRLRDVPSRRAGAARSGVATMKTKNELHTLDRSKTLLKEALTLISRHGADYTPISYAVWYEAATGESPELARELQLVLQAGERLSDDLTYDLYQKHVIDARERAVRHSQDRLTTLIGDMQGTVSQAGARAGNVQACLAGVGASLEQADADAVRRQVGALVELVRTLDDTMSKLTAALADGQGEIVRLGEELARAKADSLTDGLTRLSNRRSFDETLERLHFESARRARPLCLMLLDVDHFKRINDRFGHPFGDRVLQGIARAVRDALPANAHAARYGGEEFAVLLPDTPEDAARRIAESIRLAVAGSGIRSASTGRSFGRVTVSIGATLLNPGETVRALVGRADRALYASKAGGRDRVTFAGDRVPDGPGDGAPIH